MNKYILLVFLVFITACKSKATYVAANATKTLSSDKIIENHYKAKKDFSTLYIKSSAHYEDGKQSQNVTAEIKIKRDEIILVSIRFLGITMAKALITPDQVKYYEKIGGKYLEGNYAALSQWLGTDLDFQKVQNMIVGQALDNLDQAKYVTTVEDQLYKLEDKTDATIKKAYYFQVDNFLIKKQRITQEDQQRMVQISYPGHSEFDKMSFPTGLIIDAIQKNKKTNITVDYNTVTFNEELSFPYSVPEGYDRIFIN